MLLLLSPPALKEMAKWPKGPDRREAGAGRGASFQVRMSIRKIGYLYCKLCGFKSGVYIFSNHKLKQFGEVKCPFLAQRGEQPWDVLTVPDGGY